MAAKRALVVDDSRSARVILSRMLEVHGLHVDTAESGEQALDYLRDTRPDVVFMDHLMPGIDGFEAVKAIKGDTRTAAIPVMMYTSQEGEAYLREARALGAAGVLSKTLMPADVARALYQLRLLPDRRDSPSSLTSTPMPQAPLPTYRSAQSAPVENSHAAPREQLADLRRSLEATLEQSARRIGNELRSALQAPPQLSESMPVRPKTPRALIAALLLFSLLPTLISGALLWRVFETGKAQLDQSNARLGILVAEQQTQIEALRAELRKREADEGAELTSKRTEILPVAYGEVPLSGARLSQVHRIFDRLQAEGFKGKIRVEYFTGDFCLVRSAAAYALAAATLPQRRCDLIGNPFDDALTIGQRQSSEYAAIVTSLAQATRGAIQVNTSNGGRKPGTAYPPQSDTLTAGDWNQAAARNHRIEITTEPHD